MKTRYITWIMSLMFSMGMISCKDLVTVDSPKNQVGAGIVFENDETANAAVLSICINMVTGSNGYQMALTTGLYADELKNYSVVVGLTQLYGNALLAGSSTNTNDIWIKAYNLIYQANAVIEGCERSGKLSSDTKKQLLAEALVIRAFWHFYLQNLYGHIPLVLTTDYLITSKLYQSDETEVYQQIIQDLTRAAGDLNDQYTGANGVAVSGERLRPNKSVANALLAIYV